VGAGTVHARQRVAAALVEQAHGLLVLEPPRILPQGLLEALERAAAAVLVEIAEAELEGGLLRIRLETPGLLELANRARHVPLLPQHRAEQDVGRGDGSHLEGSPQLRLRLVPAGRVRVERAEGEV